MIIIVQEFFGRVCWSWSRGSIFKRRDSWWRLSRTRLRSRQRIASQTWSLCSWSVRFLSSQLACFPWYEQHPETWDRAIRSFTKTRRSALLALHRLGRKHVYGKYDAARLQIGWWSCPSSHSQGHCLGWIGSEEGSSRRLPICWSRRRGKRETNFCHHGCDPLQWCGFDSTKYSWKNLFCAGTKFIEFYFKKLFFEGSRYNI